MKVIIFILLLAWLVFLGILTANPQNVIKSELAHHVGYLVFVSSLTIDDKTILKNILISTKDDKQPSKRFTCIYNSTYSIIDYSTWRDGDFKVDKNSTRAMIIIDAAYQTAMSPLVTAGKAKFLWRENEIIYNNPAKKIISGNDIKKEEIVKYNLDSSNKDWDKYTVWKSTP